MKPAIEVRGLERRFGDFRAVADVNLAVPPGSFLVLLGPSGCGKTTMLRMLAGLETPTGGEIVFGDRVISTGREGNLVPPGGRDAGLVFQSYALWPHMTVWGNVDWPLKVAGWSAQARHERISEVLNLLGIASLAKRYPSEISGGQQQRVAIARTIGPRPSILLFDEPLSNLDAKLRVEMRSELLRIHRATGATSVYVTHDQVEAMTMASHVAVMNQGRVEQFGPPLDLLENPETAFVATFVGTPPGNLLEATVTDGVLTHNGLPLGPAPSGAEDAGGAAGLLKLLYRPDSLQIRMEPGDRRIAVEYTEAAPLAGRMVVTGWTGTQRLSAVVAEMPVLNVGDRMYFELPPTAAAVYGEDDQKVITR